MYGLLHITPNIAIRTHLFMIEHPIISITTGITYDEVDKRALEGKNVKGYTLTKSAFDEATQRVLRDFKVTKKGFLYFANYYNGEA